MGRYIDAISNLTITPPDLSINLSEDAFIQMRDITQEETKGFLGLGILVPFWFIIYQHIANRENQFDLTKIQAFISTAVIIYTISIYFVLTQILISSQHFIWFSLLWLISVVIGVIRIQ